MRAAALVLIVTAVAPAAARADADDLVGRPIVLDRGEIAGAITVETNLSTNLDTEPTSIAPDLWYGVTRDLTVGVVHSADALGLVEDGDGYCLGGVNHGCEQAYSNLGLDARWSLVRGAFSAAARVRLVTRRWTPWLPSVRIGALVRWQRGRVSITADPQLQLGLDNTDLGNSAQLNVPIVIAVQPTCRWALRFRTGVYGDLSVFGDEWGAPALIGVQAAVTKHVDVSADGGFDRIGGPLNDFKLRVAWVAVAARWP